MATTNQIINEGPRRATSGMSLEQLKQYADEGRRSKDLSRALAERQLEQYKEMGPLNAAGIGAKTGINRLAGGIEQLLGPENDALKNRMYEQEQQYELAHSAYPKSTIGGMLAGDIGSFGVLETMNPFLGATRAPALAKDATLLAKALRGAQTGAMHGSLGGGAGSFLQYVPEGDSRAMNTLMGAGIGGLVGAPLGGGLAAAKEAIPAGIRSMRGRISDEELAQNANAAMGTETGIGRLLNNPFLTQVQENILKYVPFSGAGGAAKRTGEAIEQRAGKNLHDLSGGRMGFDEDINEAVQRQLQSSASGIRDASRQNYKEISDLADSLGINVDISNVKETAAAVLQRLTRTPLLAESLRKARPELFNHLENLANKEILPRRPHWNEEQFLLNQEMEKLGMNGPRYMDNPETIESLGLLRAGEGEKAWQSLLKGERNTSGAHTQLKGAYQGDIDKSINESGSTELIELGQKANDYYKNVVSKLDDPRVAQFINDPSLSQSEKIISTFLITGPTKDRVKLLKQLTDHLDPQTMSKLRNKIFSNAEGESDPKSMIDMYNKLGPKQKSELIPEPDMRKNMDKLSNLARLNPKIFTEMFNPETGAKNTLLEVISKGAEMAKPLLGLGAAGFAPLPTLATVGGARLLNHVLTNEKVRNKVVNELLGKTPEATEEGMLKMISKALGKKGKTSAVVMGATESENRKKKPNTEKYRAKRGPTVTIDSLEGEY